MVNGIEMTLSGLICRIYDIIYYGNKQRNILINSFCFYVKLCRLNKQSPLQYMKVRKLGRGRGLPWISSRDSFDMNQG